VSIISDRMRLNWNSNIRTISYDWCDGV